MARKVPLEALASNIDKLLEQYAEDVTMRIDDVVTRLGKEGAKTLKGASASAVGGTGKYARGWTTQIDKQRLGTVAIIYNSTPGLPHLLENGHANRGGGRTAGRTHIAPVEEQIVNALMEAVQNDIP